MPAFTNNINHDQILTAVSQLSDIKFLLTKTSNRLRTRKEAQASLDSDKWRKAYKKEIDSLRKMKVYCLVLCSSVSAGHKV